MLRRYPDLFAAASYLAFGLVWIATMPDVARLDRDEGFNIMKAALVERGYPLYSQTWSDQPPVFTHLLVAWRAVFGSSDAAARSLSLVINAIGLASLGRITAWLARDSRAGLLSILLAVCARQYLKLSVAVMIGLPAISMALTATALLLPRHRWRWVLVPASGALMAAAVQTKLFAVILIPMAAGIMWRAWRGPTPRGVGGDPDREPRSAEGEEPAELRRRLRRSAGASPVMLLAYTIAWVFCFAAVSFDLAPWRSPGWQQQLVETHMKSGLPTDDTQLDALRSVLMRFIEDGPLSVACICLCVLAGMSSFRKSWPALLWLLGSVLLLSQANPLRGHHRVLFSIPMAMLASTAAVELMRQFADPRKRAATIALLALPMVVGLIVHVGFGVATLGRVRDTQMDADLIAELKRRAEGFAQPRWVISDDPHIVHAAGLLVPPETAVMSDKWIQRPTTRDRMPALVKKYQPVLMLFARHDYQDRYRDFLKSATAGYELVLSANKDRTRLYQRPAQPPPHRKR